MFDTEDEDSFWMSPEFFCVLYVACLVLGLCVTARRYHRQGAFCWELTSWEHIVANDRELTHGQFAIIRLAMSLFVFFTMGVMLSEGMRMQLPSGRTATRGTIFLGTFTVWCWCLMGFYFAITGVVTALAGIGRFDFLVLGRHGRSTVFARFLWVLFQVKFSCAYLVFLVTWFVLIPAAYWGTGTDMGLLSTIPFCMHNMNVIFMTLEMYMNRLRFVHSHALFILFFGASYIIFSWGWFFYSGFFWYFFIDWSSPWTIIWYTALILILYASFIGGQKLSTYVKGRKN
eukprot:TRINITY_DN79149_c0_g1_i1.p1 TRINITY_DN79149_c0_g1~~TRINITY_DN79149_c0_g1_i1.p1  ORF type:complete len:287 (+),score=11.39 TRINITY_DN79149_c0_g1_i1:43-903(+)